MLKNDPRKCKIGERGKIFGEWRENMFFSVKGDKSDGIIDESIYQLSIYSLV